MRIISGKYKGRVITPTGKLPVRPTTDFAKTGLFNILENKFNLSSFNCLDLCSGTGSISLELISRGCKHVTSVDRDYHCIKFLKSTCDLLNISNLSPLRDDALSFLKKTSAKYDLIFADPPFDMKIHETLVTRIADAQLLLPNGVLVIEHAAKDQFDHLPGLTFTRKYGNVAFSFFLNLEAEIKKTLP